MSETPSHNSEATEATKPSVERERISHDEAELAKAALKAKEKLQGSADGDPDKMLKDALAAFPNTPWFKANPEKIDELIDALDEVNGRKVLEAVQTALDEGLTAANCWDGADKVYQLAGFDLRERGNKIFIGGKGKAEGELRDQIPDEQLVEENSLHRLRAGDHLYVHNGNQHDKVGDYETGDHSVVFLDWENKEERIARIASVGGANKPFKLGVINLLENPVTFISRPVVPMDGSEPAVS
jgi:hypothetical protein